MINLFQFAAQDQSLTYLTQIFGPMNGIFPGVPSGGSISLLGAMFKTFNSIALVVAVMIVVYVTVVSVISTAHEGKFMGKFHSMWIPLRMVVGITALVPTGSGYSGLQFLIMWVIIQGIGAADTLWNTALSYVAVTGSPFVQGLLPSAGVQNTLSNLYVSLVCDASAKMTNTLTPGDAGGEYYCAKNPTDPFCLSGGTNTPFNAASNGAYVMGPANGSCGSLVACDLNKACTGPVGDNSVSGADSLACAVCKGQKQSLALVVPQLTALANVFVQNDYYYRQFINLSWNQSDTTHWKMEYDYCQANNIPQNQCCVSRKEFINGQLMPVKVQQCQAPVTDNPSGAFFPYYTKDDPNSAGPDTVRSIYYPYGIQPITGPGSFINTYTGQYMDTLNAAITTYITLHGQEQLSGDLKDMQDAGWLMAGAYYYRFASHSNNQIDQMNVIFQANQLNLSSNNTMFNYRNSSKAADNLLAVFSSQEGGLATTSPQAARVTNMIYATQTNLDALQSYAPSKTDANPLVSMQRIGYILFVTAEVLFLALMVVFIIFAGTGSFAIFGMGTGVITGGGAVAFMMFAWIIPAIIALIGYMLTIGMLLGIYVPLIPFVVFSMGAVGWFITTIEAIAACPLIALGMMMPSGQHEVLGKAEHSLMLLLHVFLRPALMIVGLMAGMLMASVFVQFITHGFSIYTSKLSAHKDMIGSILLMIMKVSLIVLVINKCFSAIHVIPERVFSWIGGKGEGYGEDQVLGEAKGKSDAAGAAAKGAAVSGASGQQRRGGESSKGMQGNKEKADLKGKDEGNKPPESPDSGGSEGGGMESPGGNEGGDEGEGGDR